MVKTYRVYYSVKDPSGCTNSSNEVVQAENEREARAAVENKFRANLRLVSIDLVIECAF